MTCTELSALLTRIIDVKVGVIGDFALDLYYSIQTETSERSIETGQEVHWGSQPRASLGGAGNVVQNLTALGVQNIQVFGCVGNDLYGREMRTLFDQAGATTQYLLTPETGWDTCVYTKPMRGNEEMNRIDFGVHNVLTDDVFDQLFAGLEESLQTLDVLIVNQQFANPLLSQSRIDRLNTLIERFPAIRFIVDMRQLGKQIQGGTLKVNTDELARFLGEHALSELDLDWCLENGRRFNALRQGPLVITRGAQGIIYIDELEIQFIDGLALQGELDTVGAGDTVVAAWAASVGAKAKPIEALKLANLAAAVTVQKLRQTGTASPSEILALQRIYYTHE